MNIKFVEEIVKKKIPGTKTKQNQRNFKIANKKSLQVRNLSNKLSISLEKPRRDSSV